jgi:hypothetical protein
VGELFGGLRPGVLAPVAALIAMSAAVSLLWMVDHDNGWAYLTAGLLALSPIAVHGATRDAVATLSSRTDTCSIGTVQRLAGPTDGIPTTSVVHRLTCKGAGTRQMMFDNDVGSPGERLTVWWGPHGRLDPRPVSGPGAPEARRWGAATAVLVLGIEGLNSVVRLVFRRARGFHSPQAALALVMLTCGPITVQLPHEHPNLRTG